MLAKSWFLLELLVQIQGFLMKRKLSIKGVVSEKVFAIEKSSSWMEDHFHCIHARSRAIHLAMQSANVVSSCNNFEK
jgi:hypothetical protein